MSMCTKRSSQSSIDAFKRRVARGDMNETEANLLDMSGVCECGAAMRRRVGRCWSCAAKDLLAGGGVRVNAIGRTMVPAKSCDKEVRR